MAQLEKDVELLETAIEDIEEEIEEIIEGIDYEGDDQVTAKVDRAKTQLSELLDLIKNMKKENREIRALSSEDKKKSRAAMLEDIDRLKEELDAMQEEKEIADEKMYEQGVKIRRLLEENKELKKESSNPATTPAKKKKGGEVDPHKEESSGDDINLKEGGGESSSDDDDDSSIESEEPTPRAENLTPSQRIDKIVKKDDATLEELFSKEDLHEELASRYGARDNLLITFFSRPAVVNSLIDAIVNIPPITAAFDEEKEVPPVPYTASEILTSGIQPLTDMLVQPASLTRFFSLLDRNPPLPAASPVASLWYKVMSHLLQLKSMELSLHIKENSVLPKVVNHINAECVLNLLLTMLNTEAKLETYGDEFQWSHLQLIELLGAKLDTCAVTEATVSEWPTILHHTTALDNISEFLCEILTKYPFSSPLVLQMQEVPFVKRLIRNCFVIFPNELEGTGPLLSSDSPYPLYSSRLRGPVHCLQILVHILSLSVNGGSYTEVEMPPVISELLNDTSPIDHSPSPLHTIAAVLEALSQELTVVKQKADEANLSKPKNKQRNELKLLVGEYRMKILMVAVGLARTGFFWVDHALLEAGILQSIFYLFFTLPWNNVVHSMVADLFISLLPPQSPASRAGFCLVVLKDLHFLENVLKCAAKVDPISRVGFLGHIANLTTAIHRAAAVTQPIADFLDTFSEWPGFVRKMTAATEVSWQAT